MLLTRDSLPEKISDIAALDELLGEGGYWAGATTLIAGPSGIGKTLMGLHFIYQGARAGEPGILATFQENRSQLARIISSFGWSNEDENVHVLHRTVVDMNIDRERSQKESGESADHKQTDETKRIKHRRCEMNRPFMKRSGPVENFYA